MPDVPPIVKPPTVTTPSANPPSAIEIQARVVNGILVIVIIAIVGLLYGFRPNDPSMFGAFTTLVGTALSAYFGISATREVSRNVVDSANHQVTAANEQLGQLKEQHSAISAKLAAAQNTLPRGDSANDDPAIKSLRSILNT